MRAEFVAADQPHGTNVAVVRTANRGRGALDPATAFTDVDALVTRERGAMLLCFSADCPSIVLFDPARRVVAAAHSGWRGTVGGIAWKAIRRMQEEFACRADDLLACIGPGIAPCCFEVGSDVVLAVEQRMPLAKEFITLRDGRTYFDIASTIRKQVLEAGVAASRIESANVCTFCRVDEFFSYRAESGRTGRFATVVGLR